MGADTKALRNRIKSVDSTRHLTKAMGLVASSKIRRAGDRMAKAASYRKSLKSMVNMLSDCPECRKSPFMRGAGNEDPRTRFIVIAGDRGLCGGYNAGIFRLVRAQSEDAELIPIGKRACEFCKKEPVYAETFTSEQGSALARRLCEDFRDGKYDRLGVISGKYVSMLTQEPQLKWILPLRRHGKAENAGVLFEPDAASILDAAIPEYVAGCIMAAVREGFACETAARRMAMDSADKNATEMIADLMLEYNRARQGAITQEITEIVAGANAE